MNRVTLYLGAWCLLASVAAGQAGEPSSPRIMVTIPPQAWLVERVAGETGLTVESLVGPGASPHTFQPTDLQVTNLSRADLFFRIGVPAESAPWFRAIDRAERPVVVDLRDGVELRPMEAHHHTEDDPGHGHDHGHSHGHSHDHGHHESGGLDPHIWLSPERLRIMADTIARALSREDPARASTYRSNAEGLKDELRSLESDLGRRLAPLEGSAFFIFHPAWGYFAEDFGLRQVAIEIEGQEPSEHDLTRLIREGRELGIRAIFVQPQFRGRAADSVAAALGAKTVTLDPLVRDVPVNLRAAAKQLLDASAPAEPGSP